MVSKNHVLARQLVQGALDRYTAPHAQREVGDSQLIVLGAILEETTVPSQGKAGGITIKIGTKTLGALAAAAASGATATAIALLGV